MYSSSISPCLPSCWRYYGTSLKDAIGKQMRAVAFDAKTASLMASTLTASFLHLYIGPSLAGVSGLLYAINYGVLQSPFLVFSRVEGVYSGCPRGIGSLPGLSWAHLSWHHRGICQRDRSVPSIISISFFQSRRILEKKEIEETSLNRSRWQYLGDAHDKCADDSARQAADAPRTAAIKRLQPGKNQETATAGPRS